MFDLMPFDRNERNMFHYLDKLEKDFFGDFDHAFSQFRTDILDRGDHYELQAELPGFDKQDIKIDVSDGCLTITAQHNAQSEEKKEHFVRKERRYGSYSRSFDIAGIKADQIKASYQHGVLSLKLPKENQKKLENSRQIEIE